MCAAMQKILTLGPKWVPLAGLSPTCCPISNAKNMWKAESPIGAATTARFMSRRARAKIHSIRPFSKQGGKRAIPYQQITTAINKKASPPWK